MSVPASVKGMRKEWTIPKNGELRFEVEFTEKVTLKLLRGTAEVYGMELCVNKEYQVCGAKVAVFSYDGGVVEVRGKCEVEYVSEETVVNAYLNTHLAIEAMRREAVERRSEPPRVVVIGSSRTTVARTLLNYAVRAGKQPMYIDLDTRNGNLVIPGAIGAHVLDRVIDVEDAVIEGQPCSYFFGHPSPADNPKLYRKMLGRLAFAANGRLASMDDALKVGAIICTAGEGEEFIGEIQEQYRARLVLVVGNERLHSTVSKHLQGQSGCTVLKLPKSGGVVTKDNAFRRQHMHHQFQKYFYGAKQEYSPFSITIGFDEASIRRLGEDVLAPQSALPLGAARRVDEHKAVRVEPNSSNLLYSILAVSWAASEEELLEANVASFIYINGIDETKRQITALSTCPGKLPSPFLLQGNLKWIEK